MGRKLQHGVQESTDDKQEQIRHTLNSKVKRKLIVTEISTRCKDPTKSLNIVSNSRHS